ncbi:hypothetical protein A2U01_0105323, partial [Trifolium medium]|nr:hypothetical protein [Trifolium medium]
WQLNYPTILPLKPLSHRVDNGWLQSPMVEIMESGAVTSRGSCDHGV